MSDVHVSVPETASITPFEEERPGIATLTLIFEPSRDTSYDSTSLTAFFGFWPRFARSCSDLAIMLISSSEARPAFSAEVAPARSFFASPLNVAA